MSFFRGALLTYSIIGGRSGTTVQPVQIFALSNCHSPIPSAGIMACSTGLFYPMRLHRQRNVSIVKTQVFNVNVVRIYDWGWKWQRLQISGGWFQALLRA
jgi:hypothetical protein